MASDGENTLDLTAVKKSFELCREENDEINIDHYIVGYRELNKFFGYFGTIFNFVVSDVKSKLEIIENHRKSPEESHYKTVQSMIKYEIAEKKTHIKGKHPSGCRTLLRLHRAQEFIEAFLLGMVSMSSEDSVSVMGSQAYNDTLAKHHPWLVRKGVGLAMYTLPTQEKMLEHIEGHSTEEALVLMKDVAETIKPVYNIIQKLYEENNLLNLP